MLCFLTVSSKKQGEWLPKTTKTHQKPWQKPRKLQQNKWKKAGDCISQQCSICNIFRSFSWLFAGSGPFPKKFPLIDAKPTDSRALKLTNERSTDWGFGWTVVMTPKLIYNSTIYFWMFGLCFPVSHWCSSPWSKIETNLGQWKMDRLSIQWAHQNVNRFW